MYVLLYASVLVTRRHRELCCGSLLKRMSYNGSYARNPLHAKNKNINFLAVYEGGRQVPAKPLYPDLDNDVYVRSYLNLFTSTGKVWLDEGNGLSHADFRHDYTFFGFDLTPDACDGSCFHLVQKGNLRVDVHIRDALLETANVVAYAKLETVLEIDKSRNIIYDF